MSGIERIAAEQRRQRTVKGYTAEHDDKHDSGDLAVAGACYALRSGSLTSSEFSWGVRYFEQATDLWPFDEEYFKGTEDPVRMLEKAGALIASEIDRLQRRKVTMNFCDAWNTAIIISRGTRNE